MKTYRTKEIVRKSTKRGTQQYKFGDGHQCVAHTPGLILGRFTEIQRNVNQHAVIFMDKMHMKLSSAKY